MKKKLIGFEKGNKKRNVEVFKVPFWREGIGLMFQKKEKARALLFSYNFSTRMTIFSLFIPFDFLAVWVDKEGKILMVQVVKPGNMSARPKKKFRKLIEIPMTKNYGEIVKFVLENYKKGLKIKFF